jgi:hypothetical protein
MYFPYQVTLFSGKGKVVPVFIFNLAPRHDGILDLGTRWRWVVSFTPRPLYPPGKEPLLPIGQEAGWSPEPVWTRGWGEKFPGSTWTRTPDNDSVLYYINITVVYLIEMGVGALNPGVTQLGREADHSPSSSDEVKDIWSCISSPPIHLHGVVLG